MTTTTRKKPIRLTPHCAGIRMTTRQYDQADFEKGWRYELIDGVLVVSPPPSSQERVPNDELGFLLRTYQRSHPEGAALDETAPEQEIDTGTNRRRADRAIWCGLGRLPRENETPTVVVEFVSPGKQAVKRDYEDKRDEYMAIKVQEYWVIDRFKRTLTVYSQKNGRNVKRVFKETQIYKTPLLPGFELPLAELFGFSDKFES